MQLPQSVVFLLHFAYHTGFNSGPFAHHIKRYSQEECESRARPWRPRLRAIGLTTRYGWRWSPLQVTGDKRLGWWVARPSR